MVEIAAPLAPEKPDRLWRAALRSPSFMFGAALTSIIIVAVFQWTIQPGPHMYNYRRVCGPFSPSSWKPSCECHGVHEGFFLYCSAIR